MTSRREWTEDSAVSTIGAIYDAALIPDGWHNALEHVRRQFCLVSAALLIHNADRSKAQGVAAGVDQAGHQEQIDSGLFRNSLVYRRSRGYPGEIIRGYELVAPEIWRRSRMYQEYWVPRRFYDCLRLTIAMDADGIYHAINLVRPIGSSVFDRDDIGLASMLMPHLQRSVRLRRHLQQTDMAAAAALDALEALRHPILVLDRNARVLHANAAAEAMLQRGDALCTAHGVLCAVAPSWTNRLHKILARASGQTGDFAAAGALQLPRRDGAARLSLLAMPCRSEPRWSLPSDPAVIVCATAPDQIRVPQSRHIGAMFGLSPGEALLASELLAGRTLREIAEQRGRSINTVRTQLARLMAKTNVTRQAELVRLLAGIPAPGNGSLGNR